MLEIIENWSLLKTLFWLVGMWACQQTFISSAIIWFRAYKNRSFLISKKIMTEEDASDIVQVLIHIVFGIMFFLLTYFIFKTNIFLGFFNLFLLLAFSIVLIKVPLNEIKKIKSSKRFPSILFKRKFYNLLSPISTGIFGIVLLVVSLFLK